MNRVHYQWITFVLFFTGLLVMFSLYSTITTGTFIAQDLSVPVFQAPYASMAFSFAFAFGCLVYGLLSDKLGRKRVMIYGLIAHTIFTVISVFSTTFTMFVVLRASCLPRLGGCSLCTHHYCVHFRLIPSSKTCHSNELCHNGLFICGNIWPSSE